MIFAGNYTVASRRKQAWGWFYEMLIFLVWLWFGVFAHGLGLVTELVLYLIWPSLETARDSILPSTILLALACWTMVWMAITTLLSAFTGMTLGKVLAGTKVVKADGTKAGPRRMLLRDVVGKGMFVPFIAQFLWLANAMTLFGSEEDRGLWDQIAGTTVVERN